MGFDKSSSGAALSKGWTILFAAVEYEIVSSDTLLGYF